MNTLSCCVRFALLLPMCLALLLPAMAEGKKGKGPGDGSGMEHPDMHAALDALRKAKSSTEPLADLNAAHTRLEQGRKNKEGFRARAINLIEKAMAERKAKHNVESEKLIDEAITVIEKAVAVSPNR